MGSEEAGDLNIVVLALSTAMCFALVSETLSWFLIYRHPEYKKTVGEIVELQDRVELMQEKIKYSQGAQSYS